MLAMSAGMGGLSEGTGVVTGAITGILGTVMRVAPAFGVAGVAVGAMATGFGVLGAATVAMLAPLASAADGAAIMESRLKLALVTATAAKASMEALREISNTTGVSFETTAASFLRFARMNDSIGATRAQLLQMTESMQKLGAISGATPEQQQSGTNQLSQALQRGSLQGEDLRSLSNSMPALLDVIAKSLGRSTGELRAMGAAGELTAQRIVAALLGATTQINDQFDTLPATASDAFNRVGNAWGLLMENMGKRLNASGIMQRLAGVVEGVVGAVDRSIAAPDPATQAAARAARLRDWGGPNDKLLWREQRAAARMGGGTTMNGEDGSEVVSANERAARTIEAAEIVRAAKEEADRIAADAKTNLAALRRPFDRGNELATTSDRTAQQVTKLTAELATYEAAVKAANDNPLTFASPEDQDHLAKLVQQIAAVKRELENTLPVLAKFWQETNRKADALEQFGGGGGMSIALQAEQMRDQAAKLGQNISGEDARGAVIASRVQGVREQNADLGQQVEAQGRLTAAIGKGRDAQIAAEAANKALTLTYQQFGTLTTPAATAALTAYESALRSLLNAQKEAADQQTLLNQKMEASVASAGLAALRAGGNAGEVSWAQQQEQFRQRRLAIIGDGSAPAGVAGGPAAVTPPPPGSMTEALTAAPPPGSVLAGLLGPAAGAGGAGAGASGPVAPFTGSAPAGMAAEVAAAITAEAAKQNRDARTMMAVSMVESGGKQLGANRIGATGTFQLMPDTAKGLGVDATDLGQNVRGGTTYYGAQLDATGGNPYSAYARYHDGPAARTAAAYGRTGDLNTLGPEGQAGILSLERNLVAMGGPNRATAFGTPGTAAPAATVAPIPATGRATALEVVEGQRSAADTAWTVRAETAIRTNEREAANAAERRASARPADVQRVQTARAEAAGMAPRDQAAVQASAEARLNAQAQEQIDRRSISMERQIDLTDKLTEAQRIGGTEGAVLAAQAQQMNQIVQSGLPLTQQQIDKELQLTAVLTQQREAQKQLQNMRALGEEVGNVLGNALEHAALQGGKFKDVLKGLEQDLLRILWRETVTKPLSNMLGSLASGGSGDTGSATSGLGGIAGLIGRAIGSSGSGAAAAASGASYTMAPAAGGFAEASAAAAGAFAKGDVFAGGNVIPFAKGGGDTVDRPTVFPMSGGRTGLMGEAGPEAIVPLRRGADGNLGVAVQGGGGGQQPSRAAPNVSITINTPNADSFRASQGQIAAAASRVVTRASRNL
jgi:tape measure domain-containing protein